MSGYNVTAGVMVTPPNSHRSVPAMSYNRPMYAILEAFGLTPTSRLPIEGAVARVVGGVKVWINPLPLGPVRWKRSTHRLMCECPQCGATLSAGRLHQHRNTVACFRQWLARVASR